MKKLFGSFFVLVALFLVGCASTPVVIADNAPIAVVTVQGNQSLIWLEADNPTVSDEDADDGTGVISTLVNKALNGSDPELQTAHDRVDYAMDSLHQLLEENAGAEVIDGETLLAAKNYIYAAENIFNILETSIPATGYKNLMQMGAKNARTMMQEIGAKSLLMADFTFKKTVITGTKRRGELGAYVIMKVRFLNEQGREIVNHEYIATSVTTIPIINSKYEKDALVELYPEAIDAAINQFIVNNL